MFKNHLLALIICSIFTFLAFGSDGESEKKDSSKMDTEAFTISKRFVEDRLKAPGSADFPVLDFTSKYQGDGTYIVTSYVDAQNSFGAMIRMYYVAKLKYNGGDWSSRLNWTLLDLQTTDK